MTRKLITYYLSLSLLLGSIGVNVFTHVCHLFDVTETSLFTLDKCCDPIDTGNETTIDFSCCSIDHDHYQLEIETENNWTENVTFFQTELPTQSNFDFFPSTGSVFLHSTPCNSPPGKYNRSLLSFIQVMRV